MMTKAATIKNLKAILFYAGAVALCVPPLFVFAWMIMTGLKTGSQNISYPPEFVFTPTLENFQAVFQQHNFLYYLFNSLVIAGLATFISLVLGLPAAYSIAKYRQGKIGMMILLARMTPFVSYLLPWYIIFRYLKLIDTYTALTVTHLIITMPMVIWLMVSFFESIPAELEDAAMIDGCSRWQSFIRIVLPLVRNGIATSAIMSFIFSCISAMRLSICSPAFFAMKGIGATALITILASLQVFLPASSVINTDAETTFMPASMVLNFM